MFYVIGLLQTFSDLYLLLTFWFVVLLICSKDFRILVKQIKRIALSRQANKAILIKKTLYSYYFE